jgi:hypothetical protein
VVKVGPLLEFGVIGVDHRYSNKKALHRRAFLR